MNTVQSIGLLALTAVALVVSGVIAALGHPVPDQMWTIDTVLVGATAGVTMPALKSAEPTTPKSSATYTPPS